MFKFNLSSFISSRLLKCVTVHIEHTEHRLYLYSAVEADESHSCHIEYSFGFDYHFIPTNFIPLDAILALLFV